LLKSSTSLSKNNRRQSTQIISINKEPTYILTLKNYTIDDSTIELSPSKSRLNSIVKYMSDLENQIPLASDLLTEDINNVNNSIFKKLFLFIFLYTVSFLCTFNRSLDPFLYYEICFNFLK
jgi:hypothetical protein